MSTKANPGKFNCWAAAMPDEPVFTILGRDPAFPATVAFWKMERQRLGKNETDDDMSRLLAIPREIQSAVDWREANLHGPNGEPTWRTKMSFVVDETQPIRVPANIAPRYLNHDEVLADMRELLDKLESGSVGEVYDDHVRATELFGVLKDVVRDMAEPVESNTYNGEPEVIQPIYTEGLIRTVQGDLTIKQINDRLTHTATIPHLRPDAKLTPGERVVVDSQPEDLAHKPEVPQHRFSMFSKGENYAYARGLEIAPTHLPTALDAMLKDGWALVSLFGATDAANVGFIFERAVPPQVMIEFQQNAETEALFKRYMTERPDWKFPGSRVTISDEVDQYRKGHPDLHFDNSQILASLDKVKGTAERMSAQINAARAGPKIEVHVEGMAPADAILLMSVIECRMQWLPQDYESVRVVGLIAEDPEAAFDFTQRRGQVEKRKTLIKGDCGATEFGRQLEG